MTGVRLRGVRSHDERAGSALRTPEGEPPVQSGAAQVLRQEALQVHQQQLHQHAPPGADLRPKPANLTS